MFISTATSPEEADRSADVAVLPVGSFEQHGGHLPLATDTLIAAAIARRIARDYALFLLPPLTFGCSHEHADFAGSVSISSTTMHTIINDVVESLALAGIAKLVVVNGHGGNYFISNIVQEANVEHRRMLLFPQRTEWTQARLASGLETGNHEDMHGGEAETSILLAECPEVVRASYRDSDFTVSERPYLLTVGVSGYSKSGVIGRPSLASADKGKRLLDSFSARFEEALSTLR